MKVIEQIGRAVRGSFRWALRARQSAEASLQASGLQQGTAMVVSWAITASIGMALMYFLWWLVIAGMVVVLIAQAADRDVLAPLPDPQWRSGVRGVGLYDYEGNRIDTHDQE